MNRVRLALFLTLLVLAGGLAPATLAQTGGDSGPQVAPTPRAKSAPAATTAADHGAPQSPGGFSPVGGRSSTSEVAAEKVGPATTSTGGSQPGAKRTVPTVSVPAGTSVLPRAAESVSIQRAGKTVTAHPLSTTRLADGSEAITGRLIVRFKDGTSGADRDTVHRAAGGRGAGAARPVAAVGPDGHLVDVTGASSLEAAKQAYEADAHVASVEVDRVLHKAEVPNDPLFSQQWGMGILQTPQAWDITHGNGPLVAILDCGIYDETSSFPAPDHGAGHPDLRGKVASRIDFTGSAFGTDDFCDHGTHVAGIVGANTNNGIGVAGVGYSTHLLNAKVLDDTGSGTTSTVVNGIYWAANNGARVINMSLGGTGACPSVMQDAINYAWSLNVVVVAAAGNEGAPGADQPANCNHTVAVGSTDSNDARSFFSNYGSTVQVAAPGGFDAFSHGILSTNFVGLYEEESGTSMSAPHVSGLAALLWTTIWSTSTGAQGVVDRLEHTADQVPGTGSFWVFGRVNAKRAVLPPLPASVSTNLSTVSIGSPVTVSWNISNPTPWDWIGVYRPGDPDTAPFTWARVNCTDTATVAIPIGSCQYTPQQTLGAIEFRVFADSTYNRIGQSGVVNVVRPPAASFSAIPATVAPGGPTTVSWSGLIGANASDWIGIFDAGAPNNAYLDWRYLDCTQVPGFATSEGSCAMPVPLAPGTYDLRLFAAGTLTALNTTSIFEPLVGPDGYSVTPSSALVGSTVSATWTNIHTPSATDWLGIFPQGASSTGWLDWKYVSCTRTASMALTSGSCSFTLPQAAGTYEIRLYSRSSANQMGSAAVTAVAPTVTSFTASPSTVVGGGTVSVSWTGLNLPTTTDWLGLYASNSAAASGFVDWKYTSSCSRTAGAAAVSSGSCGFTMPAVAGTTYEFRLYSHNGSVLIQTTSPLTVLPPPPTTLSAAPLVVRPGEATGLSWTNIAIPSDSDWIGLYTSSTAADTAFVDWEFVSCSRTRGGPRASGACPFMLPTTPGETYEFRLFANNGFTRLASAGPVVARPTVGTLSLINPTVAAGATVSLTWQELNPANKSDWIGLFESGAPNSGYRDWKYVSCSRTAGVAGLPTGFCDFTAPAAPGSYELRLFANNTFVQIGTSVPFTVTPPTSPVVVATPTQLAPGGSITVSWGGDTGATSADWIGLALVGTPNTSFVDWSYVSCTHTRGAAATSGFCTFVAPQTPGTYEMRLFANNGYTRLATSGPITVGAGAAAVQDAPVTNKPSGPTPATKP